MGFFDRIRGLFGGGSSPVENPSEIVESVLEELEDDALQDIWENFADAEGARDSLEIAHEFEEFAHDSNGMELFRLGWVDFDAEGGSDEVQAARDAFFDLMEEYDISRDEFDWDAWRDWYKD